ncbi:hypothetical protein ACYZTM_26465 [Pseudomonas sp. MDT2-39-1]|nr:hypothetical protein [Pseudomonas sp. BGI-2]
MLVRANQLIESEREIATTRAGTGPHSAVVSKGVCAYAAQRKEKRNF